MAKDGKAIGIIAINDPIKWDTKEAITRLHQKGLKTVLFKGDKRIIHDLEILAEHNYGEDFDGNQIPLPAELSHLWN